MIVALFFILENIMQSILTLKRSSFLFVDNVNLTRGVGKTVNVDDITDNTIEKLNIYITGGAIESSEGLLYRPMSADVQVEGTAVLAEDNVEPEGEGEAVTVNVKPPQIKHRRTSAKEKKNLG